MQDQQVNGLSLETQVKFMLAVINRQLGDPKVSILKTIRSGCYSSYTDTLIWKHRDEIPENSIVIMPSVVRGSRTPGMIETLAEKLDEYKQIKLIILLGNCALDKVLVNENISKGRLTPRAALADLWPEDLKGTEFAMAINVLINEHLREEDNPYHFLFPSNPFSSKGVASWIASEEDKARGFVAGFAYTNRGFTAEALYELRKSGLAAFEDLGIDYASGDLQTAKENINLAIEVVLYTIFAGTPLERVNVSIGPFRRR